MIQQLTNEPVQPRRVLTLFDAVSIIVGTIIGAGVFQTAPDIASLAGSFSWLIALWIFGGVLTLIGALCFAELTTSNRDAVGGDYVYLKLAYGQPVGFMFAWAAFWIIRPANIGAMAMIFASYFDQILPTGMQPDSGFTSALVSLLRYFDQILPTGLQLVYAILAVLILSGANLIGLKQGKWVQNVLTVAKVAGILGIVALAVFVPVDATTNTAQALSDGPSGLWLIALVLIMFSFGGWNDISFVAAEIQNPERNLFRSLVLGSVLVTFVYVVMNIAFFAALGYEQMASSKAVATDVVRATLGEDSFIGIQSVRIIAALVCISCLGAINGIIITSPRIYFAAGKDYRVVGRLGRWDLRRNQPWQATILQAVVTILLFSLCFLYEKPFNVILYASAPIFWSFLGLAGLSLIVLREKRKSADKTHRSVHYRVPLYPLPPLILTTACLAMTYSSIKYVIDNGYYGAAGVVFGIMVLGILLGLVLKPHNLPH